MASFHVRKKQRQQRNICSLFSGQTDCAEGPGEAARERGSSEGADGGVGGALEGERQHSPGTRLAGMQRGRRAHPACCRRLRHFAAGLKGVQDPDVV